MHLPVVDAVIFDCDGTLVDSEPLALEVMLALAIEVGLPATVSHDISAFEGRSMDYALSVLAEQLGRPLPANFEPLLRLRMAEVFRERLELVPGARDVVQGLSLPCCVASNGPRHKIELTLGITGLLPHFAGRIFSADEVRAWKPDPGLFLAAARAMGVEACRCAVVEDSVPGLQAGLAAGMTVYAFRPVRQIPADLLPQVHTLAHLADLRSADWYR